MRFVISRFIGLLILTFWAVGPSLASEPKLKVSFIAKIDRVILPSGEVLKQPLAAGTKVSGEAELSSSDTRKGKPPQNEGVYWYGAVKSLNFRGDLGIRFTGGNLTLAGEQLRLSATRPYCQNCKAEGPAFQTKGATAPGDEIAKTYYAINYLLMQGSGHKVGEPSFEDLVKNMASLANDGKTKVMLQFSEKGQLTFPLKMVLSIESMKID